MAKILCVSDIHISASNGLPYYGDNLSEEFSNSIRVDKLQLLFEAIENIGPIDLLIFCGDYIIGKENVAEKEKAMEEFLEFLKRIENSKKIFETNDIHVRERIVIAPGNHDINRGEKDIFSRFKNDLNIYRTPFVLPSRDQEYAPIFIYDDLKLILACESTVDNSSTINNEIEDVLKKVNKLNGKKEIKDSIKDTLKKYRLFDIPSITEKQRSEFITSCEKMKTDSKYDQYLKIMITHHPLLDGIETSNVVKKYKSTVGGYSFMKSAMQFGYKLFIHGHIHDASNIEIIDHNLDTETPAIQIGVPKTGGILINTDVEEEMSFPFMCTMLEWDNIKRRFKRQPMNLDDKKNIVYQGDHILVDKEIHQIIAERKIVEGAEESNIEAASYDCALGLEYKRGTSKYCNWSQIAKSIIKPLPEEPGYIEIAPGETIYIYTYEKFHVPDDMVLHASPISSWQKKGICVGLSYLVDPGFEGQFGFPITNESENSIRIDSREPIVSIEFIKLPKPCKKNWSTRHPEKKEARLNHKD